MPNRLFCLISFILSISQKFLPFSGKSPRHGSYRVKMIAEANLSENFWGNQCLNLGIDMLCFLLCLVQTQTLYLIQISDESLRVCQTGTGTASLCLHRKETISVRAKSWMLEAFMKKQRSLSLAHTFRHPSNYFAFNYVIQPL